MRALGVWEGGVQPQLQGVPGWGEAPGKGHTDRSMSKRLWGHQADVGFLGEKSEKDEVRLSNWAPLA